MARWVQWAGFLVATYGCYMWMGHLSPRGWLLAGGLMALGLGLHCAGRSARAKRSRRVERRPGPAYLDDDGNLQWRDDGPRSPR